MTIEDERRVRELTPKPDGTAQEKEEEKDGKTSPEQILGTYNSATVWDLFAEAQEDEHHQQEAWLIRSFLLGESISSPLKGHQVLTRAEKNLDAFEALVEQARVMQEAAGQTLAREPANAYAGFLDSLFLYWRESARAAERDDTRG